MRCGMPAGLGLRTSESRMSVTGAADSESTYPIMRSPPWRAPAGRICSAGDSDSDDRVGEAWIEGLGDVGRR